MSLPPPSPEHTSCMFSPETDPPPFKDSESVLLLFGAWMRKKNAFIRSAAFPRRKWIVCRNEKQTIGPLINGLPPPTKIKDNY